MHQVITQEQAKQITGGRTPLLPAEYEDALRALSACVDIDEAKYWSTRADILAAWSKIYHSDEVMRKAKILKLHAYRRMSEIASQIRPTKSGPNGDGPQKYLIEQGLKKYQAEEVRAVGRAPRPLFEQALVMKNPPSPSWFKKTDGRAEDGGRSFVMTVIAFRDFCRRTDADDLVGLVAKKDVLRQAAIEIGEWADSLEQACE